MPSTSGGQSTGSVAFLQVIPAKAKGMNELRTRTCVDAALHEPVTHVQ